MSQQNKNLRPATMRRVLRLIAPYRALVLLSLLLAAATVVTTLYAPIVTGQGVDLIIGPGRWTLPGWGGWLSSWRCWWRRPPCASG